jgi:chloride channel 7
VLFVPSLLSGAAFGRLFVYLLRKLDLIRVLPTQGTYALMGAAAVLGGMARMTISLTVILWKRQGNAICASTHVDVDVGFTGNVFNEGLLIFHNQVKEAFPFLEPDVPPIATKRDCRWTGYDRGQVFATCRTRGGSIRLAS